MVTKSKHKPRPTPGPWKAVKGLDLHGDEDDQDANRCSVVVDGPHQYFIATIENGAPGDTCESEFCNALLVAAAPDYAAGVEAMLDSEPMGGDDWKKAWEMVKAAHMKAIGKVV